VLNRVVRVVATPDRSIGQTPLRLPRTEVFEDTVLGVAAVSAPEVTQNLATVVLGAFDDLGTGDREVLFQTFRTWIRNRGSVSQTAAEMFCHPDAVRHRLRRIEERAAVRSVFRVNWLNCVSHSRSVSAFVKHARTSGRRGARMAAHRRHHVPPSANERCWQHSDGTSAPDRHRELKLWLSVVAEHNGRLAIE
jgi:hypothetical protein